MRSALFAYIMKELRKREVYPSPLCFIIMSIAIKFPAAIVKWLN